MPRPKEYTISGVDVALSALAAQNNAGRAWMTKKMWRHQHRLNRVYRAIACEAATLNMIYGHAAVQHETDGDEITMRVVPIIEEGLCYDAEKNTAKAH